MHAEKMELWVSSPGAPRGQFLRQFPQELQPLQDDQGAIDRLRSHQRGEA